MSKSKVKSMLIAFFDVKGIVHKAFVPPGQTVNGQYYREVLRRLTARVHRVRSKIADSWILHHDNAPSHTCLLITEQLAKQSRATLPQPPYSPDMAPPDFFLFPKIKRHLKGTRFGTLENVQRATTRALDNTEVADFQGLENTISACYRLQWGLL
ncbi:hypothetical protein J6590_108791 [Homalodisca vitripennis]|nr:hypothetical protein J6590_108791 [Homalodisca vitripennis]